MTTGICYVFADESGTTAPFSGSQFFVIALLCITEPRSIELHVKRMYKKYGTNLASGEMKASLSQEKVIEQLLRNIAQEPLEIITIIVDKREIVRPPKDTENIYRQAISQAIRHAVSRWPRLDIYLDSRYTTNRLRYRLEEAIREAIVDLPRQVVIIRQEDSITHKELQAVDFIAWAIFQKYEHEEERFYQILANRIVIEEVIKQKLW